MTQLSVAALQMAMADDLAENVATAERLVRDAAATGAQIILIPELFEGPYFCKDQLPEHLDGHCRSTATRRSRTSGASPPNSAWCCRSASTSVPARRCSTRS